MIRSRRDALRAAAPHALRARCAARVRAGRPRPAAPRAVPLSLAASLLLAAGGALVFTLSHPVEALAAGLALDHMKCFRIGENDRAMDAPAAQAAWRRAYDWTVVVPPGERREGLELVNVRRCLSSAGLAAHLMYRWHGQPLSVYVLPRRVDDGGGIVETLGYETAIWTGADRTYAVVAPGHPAAFGELVDYVKANAR